MALTVKSLLEVETIRDGGSLAAIFRDDDGAKWILFLTIDQIHHDTSETRGIAETLGFKEPLLIDADPAKRSPDTEGRFYSELSGPASPISWEDAETLVGQMAKLATTLDKWASRSFDDLSIAVANRGARLPDRARFAPTRRFYPKRDL